jgi:hypothetical protein
MPVFAQAVVEYGAIASAIAKGKEAASAFEAWASSFSPETWMAAGGVVLLALILIARWRARS